MPRTSIGQRATVFFLAASLFALRAGAQGGTPVPPRTVAETYKNIQALTDMNGRPSPELISTMQFIAGSLSVTCFYCHSGQPNAFDSDEKKTKLRAREMIRMVRTINEASFGGRLVVTCNTCHRGNPKPEPAPSTWNKTSDELAYLSKYYPPNPPDTGSANTRTAPVLPSVEQVFANYRKAVGATSVTSMHLSGSTDGLRGFRSRDMYISFPDKIAVSTTAGGGVQQIVNGDQGWQVTPQARVALSPAQITAVRNGAALYLPVKHETASAPRKVAGIETLGGRAYYVVESVLDQTTERLFFDVQSGLLLKRQTALPTWLGTKIEEVTYEDYRDVGGVKLPFLVANRYMEDELLFRIDEIQINVPIDPKKFAPPT